MDCDAASSGTDTEERASAVVGGYHAIISGSTASARSSSQVVEAVCYGVALVAVYGGTSGVSTVVTAELQVLYTPPDDNVLCINSIKSRVGIFTQL